MKVVYDNVVLLSRVEIAQCKQIRCCLFEIGHYFQKWWKIYSWILSSWHFFQQTFKYNRQKSAFSSAKFWYHDLWCKNCTMNTITDLYYFTGFACVIGWSIDVEFALVSRFSCVDFHFVQFFDCMDSVTSCAHYLRSHLFGCGDHFCHHVVIHCASFSIVCVNCDLYVLLRFYLCLLGLDGSCYLFLYGFGQRSGWCVVYPSAFGFCGCWWLLLMLLLHCVSP